MTQKKLSNLFIAGLIGASAFAINTTVFADDNMLSGMYAGIQGGYASVDYDVKSPSTSVNISSSKDGFANRIYAGFNFNPYLAIEGGYAYLPKAEYKYSGAITGKSTIKTAIWDVVGKVSLPLDSMPVNLYADAGMAYVNAEGDDNSENNWLPIAGIGAAYKLDDNWAVGVSYSHVFGENRGSGDFYSTKPSINFTAVGLTYKF